VVRRVLDFALDHPPPLAFGEGEPTALLLAMVLHHCATTQPDELDSYGVKANADAIAMLDDSGEIEITSQRGDRITAKLTFEGRVLLASLRAEQDSHERSNTPKPLTTDESEHPLMRCRACGWVHVGTPAPEPAGDRCYRCKGARTQGHRVRDH
jgi:hypothetical protein